MSPFPRLAVLAPLLLVACSDDVAGKWLDQSPTARLWVLDTSGSGSDEIPLPEDEKIVGALTWSEVEQDDRFDGSAGEGEARIDVVEKCHTATDLCAGERKYAVGGEPLSEVVWSCWFDDECLGCTATWDTDSGATLRTLNNVPLILGRVADNGSARTDCPGF